ncbi:MAG: 2-amino-4-hydroxy-6-hydroxymethyldihydropteridine diphosphokinase [Candidatus Latescibacteria bacterium]|nr:2-amino-4-hydroxy-6-hydroxymethyldihydropteridine diphosphokinase [Candidatus Latescibacterota bacterium]NIM21040.1 2-amino-4-hydroxy-6-hydroxymethyldihydropteridine diphosphokinase [Candidatus Latescibacterota bacterium]NIM65175.1 2-amino-4-hydroxy-6-hydroxymethyldihydropteridine diphosphokinase [Candidatus Latescibacterota bacterium]NIO01690.1 2-amino-4-hydroxy-6-hydroxymethyldihydropteridine diphosphokinase [Candidatus Latescibacterota bacterium]NIO28207.1 2-amino-4-hydroxy-6-hydroxymethy
MPNQRSDDIEAHLGYLSVGSNVGDREAAVLAAVRFIEKKEGLTVRRCSSLFETAPVEGVPGGYFINSVLEVQSLLCPTDLLLRLKAVEEEMGRTSGHNEAREIDIDIVTLGGWIVRTELLTLPHPRYAERAFVLVPLREIAPEFRCPKTGRPVAEMIEDLPPGQFVSLASTRWAVHG